MKNKSSTEISVALALIILAVFVTNPFDFLMPSMVLAVSLVAVLVVFALFASFVLREQTIDERDALHRSLAGRYAFLAGAAVLMLGILYQSREHAVDIWLVLALVLMIVVKIGLRMYADRYW